jgi:hypothetical protein
MANPSSVLHKCPAVVRTGSPTLDTLYASAPFRGEAWAIVEVPPVVDSGTVPLDSINKSAAGQPLTDTNGATAKDREKLVGWQTSAEQALAEILRGRATQILEFVDAKQVHPALRPTAKEGRRPFGLKRPPADLGQHGSRENYDPVRLRVPVPHLRGSTVPRPNRMARPRSTAAHRRSTDLRRPTTKTTPRSPSSIAACSELEAFL